MHRIELKAQPRKFIKQQPRHIQRQLLDSIQDLSTDPFPANSSRLRADPSLTKVRTGDYRIIYWVDECNHCIHVTKVGNRRDVYDKYDRR